MKTKHPKPINRKPKSNWRVVEVIDLKADDPLFLFKLTCDRCNQPLRFVHILSRPGEPEFLAGRCCAARMSAGYDAALVERELTNRWNRRQKFPDLAGWKTSRRSGNPYLRDYHGHSISIFKQSGEWKYCVAKDDARQFSPVSYDTQREAMLAAWDCWAELTESYS